MDHKDCGKYERSLPSLLLPCTRPLLIVFGGRGRNGGGAEYAMRSDQGERKRERTRAPFASHQITMFRWCHQLPRRCRVDMSKSTSAGWVGPTHIQYKCWKASSGSTNEGHLLAGKLTFKGQLILPPCDNVTFGTCWWIKTGYLDRQKPRLYLMRRSATSYISRQETTAQNKLNWVISITFIWNCQCMN